jgi:hypothetical protein
VAQGVRLSIVPGASPLVLVAPHGGRRDPTLRPWAAARWRVNDLHTATLTLDLAALSGGSALVNAEHDRNDIDLNRISEALDRAPEFLARLAELLDATLARHGRATLLTVHGWNVVQPALDVGLGCATGDDPFTVSPGAAVSATFAATAVRRLVAACRTRGIAATVGARYPARHRENLLQLFTSRYREDRRALAHRLAALAPRVEAMQLELGIPLRWPGAWRARLLEACAAALPALHLDDEAVPRSTVLASAPDPAPAPRRLQFTGPRLCGLAAAGGDGGRLLLFPPEGGLFLFTGEHTGIETPGGLGTLALRAAPGGRLRLGFRGPLLHFADTTPFLDLEAGLATARLIEAQVSLDFEPDHSALPTAGGPGGDFGAVSGQVVLDGWRAAITGQGFGAEEPATGPWPRLRAALRLANRAGLAVTADLDGSRASGFVCRGGRHIPLLEARVALGPAHAPLERLALDLRLTDGERVSIVARARHRLPVVRTRGPVPVRLEFAACRLDGGQDDEACSAGWCEVAGF